MVMISVTIVLIHCSTSQCSKIQQKCARKIIKSLLAKKKILFWLCGHEDQTFLTSYCKSKQDVSKEVIVEVKQFFFQKLSVIYCCIECLIQCWIQYDTQCDTQFNKFGYSSCNTVEMSFLFKTVIKYMVFPEIYNFT